MDILVKILALLFGFIGAAVAFLGETWRKSERGFFLRRITGLGWLAIASLFLSLCSGVAKEILAEQANRESQAREAELKSKLDESSKSAIKLHEELRSTREGLEQAIVGLSEIANAEAAETQSSNLAASALDRIFNLKRLAVVKVKAVVDGMLREKSGFFVNTRGHVLTAYFAVTDFDPLKPASHVTVETGDGSTHLAEIVHVDARVAIALLSTGIQNDSYLALSERQPIAEEEVLVLGYSEHESLTRASGSISKLYSLDGLYLRDRDYLPGFGGGPVLAIDGSVIGLNWGALEPPVQGNAKFIRSDVIAKILQELDIL